MLFEPVVEETSFTHGRDELVGDLVRPPWPGPHPAVVFVEGSGPGGRDLGTWPTRLAAGGFASLAYDKPGSGASTGDWTRQGIADRAGESVAAVRAVAGRDDIRAWAVALVGGSQGGWVAQLAATMTDQVAALVTVSGPGVGVREQEEYRLRAQLPAEGFTPRDVERALWLLREQLERVAAGEDPAAVHADQAAWRDAGWYPLLAGTTPDTIAFLARIAGYDPRPALVSLRCPLLAIFGADDVRVPVRASVRAITETLAGAGHRDHDIVVFPRADHGVRVPTDGGPPGGRGGPGARAPGFHELIVSWLHRHVR